jgi:hypothetical protein
MQPLSSPTVTPRRMSVLLVLRVFALFSLVPAVVWAFLLVSGHIWSQFGLGHWWSYVIDLSVLSVLALWATRGTPVFSPGIPLKHRLAAGFLIGAAFLVHALWAALMFASTAWTEPRLASSVRVLDDYRSVSSALHLSPTREADPDFLPDGRLIDTLRSSRCQMASVLIDGFSHRQLRPLADQGNPLTPVLVGGLSTLQWVAGCITESQWQEGMLASNRFIEQERANPGLSRFLFFGWTPKAGVVTAARLDGIVLDSSLVTRKKACTTVASVTLARLGERGFSARLPGYCESIPGAQSVVRTAGDFVLPPGWHEKLTGK